MSAETTSLSSWAKTISRGYAIRPGSSTDYAFTAVEELQHMEQQRRLPCTALHWSCMIIEAFIWEKEDCGMTPHSYIRLTHWHLFGSDTHRMEGLEAGCLRIPSYSVHKFLGILGYLR